MTELATQRQAETAAKGPKPKAALNGARSFWLKQLHSWHWISAAVSLVGMILFMAFEFTVHPPIWVHAVVTGPILVAMCLGVLRPFKSWIVAEQYIHKAAPPEFSSNGKHGPF